MSDRLRSARAALVLVGALAAVLAIDGLHKAVGPDEVHWLVAPAVALVELAGGGPFEWEPGEGFLVRSARLHVTEACAGLRFLLVATVVLALAWSDGRGRRPRALLLAVLTAFALTTLANAVRLAVALQLGRADLASRGWSFESAHAASSYAIYGAALVLLVSLARSRRVHELVRGQAASPAAA